MGHRVSKAVVVVNECNGCMNECNNITCGTVRGASPPMCSSGMPAPPPAATCADLFPPYTLCRALPLLPACPFLLAACSLTTDRCLSHFPPPCLALNSPAGGLLGC